MRLCRLGIHNYSFVVDTGKHEYLECTNCGERTVIMKFQGGYQPIDRKWLKNQFHGVEKPNKSLVFFNGKYK